MSHPASKQDLHSFISLPRPKFIINPDEERYSYSEDQHSAMKQSRISDYITNLKEQRNKTFVYMIIPPDGGYGWTILCFSFLNQFIIDGIVLGSANLFPYISKDIMEPLYLTGLIMGIQIGCYFLSAFVASAFINKYGFRPVAMLGIACAVTVLGIASFCSSLMMLIIFYSILGGPSLSLVWISSQLIVNYYFEKYRPIAAGFAASGAGVGTSSINLLNSYLLPRINWRNTVRVHLLLLVVAYFLLIGYIGIKPTRIGRVHTEESSSSDTESTESTDDDAKVGTYSVISVKHETPIIEIPSDLNIALNTHDVRTFQQKTTMIGRCCPFFSKSRCCRRFYKEADGSEQVVLIKPDILDRHDAFYIGPLEEGTEPLNKRPVTWSRTSLKVALETPKDKVRAINTRMQHIHTDTKSEVPGRTRRLIRAFTLLFNCQLMTIKEFRILWFSALLFPMGLNVPLTYATVHSNIAPQYALFITPCIGLSNFIVRIASGWIAFRYRQHVTIICGSGMVFGGLFVFLDGLFGSGIVWFQFLFCFCWAMAPGMFATLRAIVYAKFLGLDKLTNAIGLTAVAMGLGIFIGITINCFMFMYTKALNWSYMFAGICIMISGALKLSLLFLRSK